MTLVTLLLHALLDYGQHGDNVEFRVQHHFYALLLPSQRLEGFESKKLSAGSIAGRNSKKSAPEYNVYAKSLYRALGENLCLSASKAMDSTMRMMS